MNHVTVKVDNPIIQIFVLVDSFFLILFCAVRSYFNRVLSSFRDLALIYKPTWYWLMIILQSIAVLLLIGYPDCGWVSLSASFSVWLISSDLMSPWFRREWRGRRKIESGWIHRGDQEEEEKKAGISECVCVCVESSNDIYHCNLSGTTALFFLLLLFLVAGSIYAFARISPDKVEHSPFFFHLFIFPFLLSLDTNALLALLCRAFVHM